MPQPSSPSFCTCSIIGTGSYVPERILTNEELSKTVDTSDEWITTRTGIKERRIAADGQNTSDMATEAARRRAGLPGTFSCTSPCSPRCY